MIEGRADSLATLAASEAELRAAIQADPGDLTAYAILAQGLHLRSVLLQLGQQQPAGPVLEAGLEAARAGLDRAPRSPTLLRARAKLLSQRGSALEDEGKDGLESFAEAARVSEEAMALDPRRAASYREVMQHALLGLAKQQWKAGQDPRAAFGRAVAAAEEMLRGGQGRASAPINVAEALGYQALVRLDMGEDPREETERALVLTKVPPGAASTAPTYLLSEAMFLNLEAMRRSIVGEDPSPMVARARDLIARVTRGTRDIGPVAENAGVLALCQAKGLAARGKDPRAELDLAERHLRGLVASSPTFPPGQKELAEVALVRALWLRRSGASPVEAARAGLAHAEKGLELDPREGVIAVLKARLHLLAGDRATARQSLDRAYALQPLLKGNRDARAAEAELGS